MFPTHHTFPTKEAQEASRRQSTAFDPASKPLLTKKKVATQDHTSPSIPAMQHIEDASMRSATNTPEDIERLSEAFDGLNQHDRSLTKLSERVSLLEEKVDALDIKMDSLGLRIDVLTKEMSQLRTSLGSILMSGPGTPASRVVGRDVGKFTLWERREEEKKAEEQAGNVKNKEPEIHGLNGPQSIHLGGRKRTNSGHESAPQVKPAHVLAKTSPFPPVFDGDEKAWDEYFGFGPGDVRPQHGYRAASSSTIAVVGGTKKPARDEQAVAEGRYGGPQDLGRQRALSGHESAPQVVPDHVKKNRVAKGDEAM
ncbi:hypothetical protein CB0940_09677 [Cercospora beticola]|uniref:Uncharacterized protein n=1 Tax=Cercospora beticola TaxID=122368 RepID=A0A2G5HGV5_CERBT|nr:hypothetical protein CB0940_09677 [Cercospora beticola]PIA91768.1 hypothetical protein CB0940_09677 [Cercospora beticola]WPB05983.1 hypothetical protein RHO25_010638 [Cercospora beticola]